MTKAYLNVNQTRIDRVKQYCYLGTTVNEKWNKTQEIKSHIGKGRTPFNKMSVIFKNHNLIIKTKMRYIRCYVFSELLNSVESWTTNDATIQRK
ncbi:unnamed protein product [Aphis gossypii]|uniref:Endonuclease-reverse transcriptase n=1 Tax=Aphis gossypii TaxID=80765 RepID=A0A9P0IXV2_APHGO|nr:unnamed protein product [Aphis gossypii]